MGLCKCPQRKVTNIFCYEHRVNVCEHCLMHNHPKCVVDTYRNWITDSVYSPKCGLCDEELTSNETVRLLCLHIVHWDCLDAWARSLPPTTAPAGYTCPICRKMCIFPQHNQVSPIADELRAKMSQVNWSRVGLGMSLLDNEPPPAKELVLNGNGLGTNPQWSPMSPSPIRDFDREVDRRSDVSEGDLSFDRSFPRGNNVEIHNHANANTNHYQNQNQNSYQNQISHNHNQNSAQSGMMASSYSKLSDSYGSPHSVPYFHDPSATTTRKSVKFDLETPLLVDEDDNKYRRRSPFESLSRWLRQMNPNNKRRSRRRTALYVIVWIIGMIILLMILYGRNSEYEDDAFNLHANPHVLVGEGKAPLGHEFDP